MMLRRYQQIQGHHYAGPEFRHLKYNASIDEQVAGIIPDYKYFSLKHPMEVLRSE